MHNIISMKVCFVSKILNFSYIFLDSSICSPPIYSESPRVVKGDYKEQSEGAGNPLLYIVLPADNKAEEEG